jgi:O-antigen ligase
MAVCGELIFMKKLKVWLVLALVFLAGFAGGVVVTRVVTRRVIAAVIAHPELVRVKIERDLNRNLKLDARQRERVHQILTGAHDRLKALRQDFQPQFVSIVQDTRTEISAVLTPEQQKKFEQFQAERSTFLPSR